MIVAGVSLDIVDLLFRLFGLNLDKELILHTYPLGYWGAFFVYFVGAIVAFFALRHPRPYGGLLIADGMLGVVFGGLVALIFGIIAIIAGGVCLVMARR